MNNNNQSINDSLAFINKTYDELSYFDLYGNSVLIFIFMSLLVFTVFSYSKIIQKRSEIASDWVNQRCKPQNILFAGLITKPEDKTAFEYTNENFQYCVQNILTNISGYALQPFQYMINTLTQVFVNMTNSIQQSREVISRLRNNIGVFSEDVLNRILNVMIPIQKMFISLMDVFQKIQGVMTGSLYTMLGSYYTLQGLMGAILELIIKMLVALTIIIVGLWVTPFTWPAAASMSAVFLGISIPLATIIYFMTEVLHIKTSSIPKLRCFDEETNITLLDNSVKYIGYLVPGDRLHDGSVVTAKIKVTSSQLDMYNLHGIIVSGCHIVKHGEHWIPVSKHPDATPLSKYNKPYLYCLNTTNKTIVINDIVFSDWDEVYGDNLTYLINLFGNKESISRNTNKGFRFDSKIMLKNNVIVNIGDIKIGDILDSDEIVYGIVGLTNEHDLGVNEYNLLVSNGKFIVNNVVENDYNHAIDSLIENKIKQNFI